jgi:DNA-binding IclR family transcriptional regulator
VSLRQPRLPGDANERPRAARQVPRAAPRRRNPRREAFDGSFHHRRDGGRLARRQALSEVADRLGAGLITLVSFINPGAIVLGGELMEAEAQVPPRIISMLDKHRPDMHQGGALRGRVAPISMRLHNVAMRVKEAERPSAPAGPGRTLLRGLQLLELLASGSDGSVTDLANAAGLDKGTTSRMLSTLREAGYVRQDGTTRRYRLSGKILWLAQGYADQLDLRGVAHPHLSALRDAVGETVHLGVREDDRVIYIDKVEAGRSIRLVSTIGHAEPVHTTALGRAILSQLQSTEQRRLVRSFDFSPLTSKTITDPEALLVLLAAARKRGYALDDEENHEDVTCVGAAIVDALGHAIAAVSCSGPSFRMRDRVAEIGPLCRATATEISRAIGGSEHGTA